MPKNSSKNDFIDQSIGTAFLLLSHAGFLATMIGTSGTGIALFIFLKSFILTDINAIRALAIGWIFIAIVLGMWVVYAINITRIASNNLKKPIFPNNAFVLLIIITILIILVSIWSIIMICI